MVERSPFLKIVSHLVMVLGVLIAAIIESILLGILSINDLAV